MRKIALALVLAAGALGATASASQAHYNSYGYGYGGGYGHSHRSNFYNSGYSYAPYCFTKTFKVYDPYYGYVWRSKVVCR